MDYGLPLYCDRGIDIELNSNAPLSQAESLITHIRPLFIVDQYGNSQIKTAAKHRRRLHRR